MSITPTVTNKRYLTRRPNGYYQLTTYSETGKKIVKSLKTKKRSEAMALFNNYEEPNIRKILKVSELLTVLKERMKNTVKASTLNLYNDVFQNFIREIGDKKLPDITVDDVENFKLKRSENIQNSTLSIELRSLKACFNKSIKWNYLVTNPFCNVELPRINKKQRAFLSEDEFKDLLTHSKNPLLNNFYSFAFYTGCRLSEIINLKWENVDLEKRLIHIKNMDDFETKTSEERTVPIANQLLEILGFISNVRGNSEYVFTKNNEGKFKLEKSYVSHNFKKIINNANEEGIVFDETLHFHSLRHSFSANCIMKGIDLFTIKEYLGHADLSMLTKLYGHISTDYKLEQIKKLDSKETVRTVKKVNHEFF